MKEIIEKAFVCFALIVFVTMLCNHGQIDFTLWDRTVDVATDAVNSQEGQELIEETKTTAYDVATIFLGKAQESVTDIKNQSDKAENKDNDSQEPENSNTSLLTTAQDKAKEIMPSGLIEVELVRVVDGDTLVIKRKDSATEEKVRLIGVNTPESVNPDEEKNTEYGEAASEYTKTLLKAFDTVYLEFDDEPTDKYGRLLCYVWLKDITDRSNAENVRKYMLNGILVSNGIATDMMIPPNVAYADMFSEFREDAETNKAGLWESDNAFN